MTRSCRTPEPRLLPALALALWVWTPVNGRAADAQLASFEGEYAFAGGPAEEARLEAAIEEVVDQMSFVVRGMARSRIQEDVQPEQRVALAALDGGRVQLTLDDWQSPPIPVGSGDARGTGPDGRPVTLTATLDGDRLAIVQASDRGTRESWFTLGPEGDRLFMQVRIGSDRLPAAIRYTLTYRRVGEPAAVARR